MEKKIIAGTILVLILMTSFPPSKTQTFMAPFGDRNSPTLMGERIEYSFIINEHNSIGRSYEVVNIAYDRLLLQYLIVIGFSFTIYLFQKRS